MWTKLLSGRFIATVALVVTYCSIMFLMAWTAKTLMYRGGDAITAGKEVMTFIVGQLTGTAIGAIIAYFFRTDRQTTSKENNG